MNAGTFQGGKISRDSNWIKGGQFTDFCHFMELVKYLSFSSFNNNFASKYQLHYKSMFSLSVSAGIIMIEYGLIPTVQTGFYCDDPKISHKFRGDTISITTLLCFTILLPFIGVS